MKKALIAIAAPIERPYIDEWVGYHLRYFDDIWIYLNKWPVDDQWVCDDIRVHTIRWDGEIQQLPAYNDFIRNHSKDYDWGLFADVDEFLVLNNWNLDDFLATHSDHFGTGLSWVLYGDSNENFNWMDYSVLRRFVRCDSHFNRHIKTFVNFACHRKFGIDDRFVNPHFTGLGIRRGLYYAADNYGDVQGPWLTRMENQLVDTYQFPYIAHFFCKTLDEYRIRRAFGRADTDEKRSGVEFYEHNRNDIYRPLN